MKKFFIYPRVLWIGGVIIIIIGGYLIFGRTARTEYETITVTRGTIQNLTSVTGSVTPREQVDLGFERSGRVTEVAGKVGDRVEVGATLVILSRGDIRARLLQAEANFEAEEARLSELKQGTRSEDLLVAREKLKGAETAADDATRALIQAFQNAYASTDDAVRAKVDQIFTEPRSQSPQIKFSTSDTQLETDLEWGRVLIENTLNSWKAALAGVSSSGNIDNLITASRENLSQARGFMEKAALATNIAKTTANASQANIDAWKVDVGTARANVNAVANNALAAEEKYRTTRSNYAVARSELSLKEAGTDPEQIKAQEARVKAAQAAVADNEAQMRNTIIIAPIAGTITRMDAKVGATVGAGTTVVSLISASQFEIKARIPEADIAQVKVGNDALVTLDAYASDVVFHARVVSVDPAAVIIEGVPTYSTTFSFTDADNRIKSGMTANIDIVSAHHVNVFAVPQKAVAKREGKSFVQILKDGNAEEREVTTGLRGSGGTLEITEGLRGGEQIIVGTRTQ